MEIKTETYKTVTGDVLTKHYLSLGDKTQVLTTQELWQLILLGVVELGKRLQPDREDDE